MSQSSYILCVTTDKCPSSGSSIHSTDAIQLICPSTGSILSNTLLRIGHTGIGLDSLSPIPNTHAYVAYGGRKESQDMHAMLLIQGSTSPIWKCRLPELMECIRSSPCGLYIIAGGKSGQCYCWSTFHQGELLRVWTAHYRTINKVCFSDCGKYVVTGGADGIIHVWSLMAIVSTDSMMDMTVTNTGKSSLNPIRTWAQHHLPITALYPMSSSRILSGSSDRQVMILEIFSGQIVARMELPIAISSITTDIVGHRVYIGGMNGCIYLIDLDTYAIASTAESATIIQTGAVRPSLNDEFKIFQHTNESSSSPSYICELHGHEKAITCLTILEDTINSVLISGGIDGSIRIWDIQARCCVRIIRPWNTAATTEQVDANTCPCTSITIIHRSDLETHATSKRKGNKNMLEATILPFQRFTRDQQQQQGDPLEDACITIPIKPTRIYVPVLSFAPYKVSRSYTSKSKRLSSDFEIQTVSTNTTEHPSIDEKNHVHEITDKHTKEMVQLKKELEEARETIQRWQKVNSKLAQRLQKDSS